MVNRKASHAGSWYTNNGTRLEHQLDEWLEQVPSNAKGIGKLSSQQGESALPTERARVIIAPHAGYAYSGPAAAWAYKALDLSKAKRVFLLGPSHHHYLSGCALSQCEAYETPMGDLVLDKVTIAELQATKQFELMSRSVDEAEHSMEMHLPYIHKVLSDTFGKSPKLPPLVPILVGATNPSTEQKFGKLLAPYLADPSSIFVISSDFCHWGSRFRYTYYQPPSGQAISLSSSTSIPASRPLHESIAIVDQASMNAIESGSHASFVEELERTNNTVCGRHPIGVVMAAIEVLKKEGKIKDGEGEFKFVRYERSELCTSIRDSSVSYCSAFAVL